MYEKNSRVSEELELFCYSKTLNVLCIHGKLTLLKVLTGSTDWTDSKELHKFDKLERMSYVVRKKAERGRRNQ